MVKRGKRRAIYENKNKKNNDDEFYYESVDDKNANLKNTSSHTENIYLDTEENLFKLCKDYAHKCDHLKYIGPSDIRRFYNECSDYVGYNASCAPIVVEFLECALQILIDEYKKIDKRRLLRLGASKESSVPEAPPSIQDQYDLYLESFKYQLCIKLSKYYTGGGMRSVDFN